MFYQKKITHFGSLVLALAWPDRYLHCVLFIQLFQMLLSVSFYGENTTRTHVQKDYIFLSVSSIDLGLTTFSRFLARLFFEETLTLSHNSKIIQHFQMKLGTHVAGNNMPVHLPVCSLGFSHLYSIPQIVQATCCFCT